MKNQEMINNVPFKEKWEDLTDEEINTAKELMKKDPVFCSHPEIFDDRQILLAFANNFNTAGGDSTDPEELLNLRLEALKEMPDIYSRNEKIDKKPISTDVVPTPGDDE